MVGLYYATLTGPDGLLVHNIRLDNLVIFFHFGLFC